MTDYYADFDLGTGDNDGTSWANAWRTMAYAIAGENGTAPAAGDTVYCRGTDTLGGTCTNAISGDTTSGYVKWIGVNGSGTNDGTRAVLDCAEGNFAALTQNGSYNLYENFQFANSGNASGVAGSGDYCVFINCYFYSNTAYGFYGSGMTGTILVRCCANGNGNDGFASDTGNKFYFCSSHDNSQSGFDIAQGTNNALIGCISYANTNDGIERVGTGGTVFNCTVDNNTDDGIVADPGDLSIQMIGNRITNHSGSGDIGLNGSTTALFVYGWNYFKDNDGDDVQNAAIAYALTHSGTATNVYDATDDDCGYATEGSDFNLNSDALLRRTAITIPTA